MVDVVSRYTIESYDKGTSIDTDFNIKDYNSSDFHQVYKFVVRIGHPVDAEKLSKICEAIEKINFPDLEELSIRGRNLSNKVVDAIVSRINKSPELIRVDLLGASFIDEKYAFQKFSVVTASKPHITSMIIYSDNEGAEKDVQSIRKQVSKNREVVKKKAAEIMPFVEKVISAAKHDQYLYVDPTRCKKNLEKFKEKVAANLIIYAQDNGEEGERFIAELKKIGGAKTLDDKQKQFLKDAAKPLEGNFKEIKHDNWIMQFAQWIWQKFAALFYKAQEGNNFKKGYTEFTNDKLDGKSFVESLDASREKYQGVAR